MKFTIMILSLFTTTFLAFAHPALESFHGRVGRAESDFLNIANSECSIEISQQAFDDGSFAPKVTLHGFDSFAYTDRSHFTISTEPKNGIYKSEFKPSTGCGDFGGMVKYKKTLELTANKVKLVESYFCLFDLESRVIDLTCHLE